MVSELSPSRGARFPTSTARGPDVPGPHVTCGLRCTGIASLPSLRAKSSDSHDSSFSSGLDDDAADSNPDDPAMGYGPIQMLVVGFDGNQFRGELWPELERLKREGVVRIIDLMLVRKDTTGAVTHIVASDLGWEEAAKFGEAMGALAGYAREGLPGVERGGMKGLAEMMDGHLFDDDDVFRLEQLVPAGMTTAVALFEHVWAAPFLEAISRANGFELLNEWVTPVQIMETGGAFERRRAWSDG